MHWRRCFGGAWLECYLPNVENIRRTIGFGRERLLSYAFSYRLLCLLGGGIQQNNLQALLWPRFCNLEAKLNNLCLKKPSTLLSLVKFGFSINLVVALNNSYLCFRMTSSLTLFFAQENGTLNSKGTPRSVRTYRVCASKSVAF